MFTASLSAEELPPQREALDDAFLDGFGHRGDIEEKTGFTFEGSVTIDYSKPLMGGRNTAGDSFRHLLDLRVSWATAPLTGWEDGTLSLDFLNQNGDNGSNEVGDLQAFGGNDADGRTQIAELWYEQVLLDHKLRLKAGKIDANAEFAFVEWCGEFIHSYNGVTATVLAFPTYPDSATGVLGFIQPFAEGEDDAGWLYAGFGVFDGEGQRGVLTGQRGPRTFFDGPNDYFLIGELGLMWSLRNDTLPGVLKLGGWGHNGDFECFDGSVRHGTGGFYFILDQTLWRPQGATEDDTRSIKAYIQYGYADPDVADFNHHISGGIVWTGALPGRTADTLGLAFSTVVLSKENEAFTESNETAIELFYGWQVRQWLTVKPDLQYIINPGGEGLDDALVATLRVIVSF